MNSYRLDRSYYSRHREILDWCESEFGPDNRVRESEQVTSWRWNMTFGYMDIDFAREADAVAFALRWL